MSATTQAPRRQVRIRLAGQTFVADGSLNQAEFRAGLLEHGLEAYSDCTGAICIRSIAEGNIARALVAEERAAREASRRRDADYWRREIGALRTQRGQCARDFQCLRKLGHDGPCIYDVRTLGALGEERASNWSAS